jgi:hypothetical protein
VQVRSRCNGINRRALRQAQTRQAARARARGRGFKRHTRAQPARAPPPPGRDAFGPDAFEINVGFGQRMLFLFHPAALEAFLKSPEDEVSFKPAVRRFTER